MTILLYYDYICPFCFIATQRVLDLAREFGLETEWLGVEIHPEYPAEGKKRRRTERTVRISQTLENVAEEAGVKIKLPGFVTNSRLCLEGAEFAKEKGSFIEFHKACYTAYFMEGKNIGLLENILEAGKSAGLHPEDLSESLQKRSFSEKIERNMESAREKMVLGVPTLYLGELRIHGIQPVESYRKLIAKELLRERPVH
ncbi:MAG: DsbA family protein [Candidatus Dadabacteria bacterium]|nr:DsbA family protein [Candidatus Dadabacteria bacterium]